MAGLSFRSFKLTRDMLKCLGQASRVHKRTGLHGFFSLGMAWRFNAVHQTMDVLTTPQKLQTLQQQSRTNVAMWEHESAGVESPQKVEVMNMDWGVATGELTQKYGRIYPVLNYANDRVPGGDFFNYGNAQEENLWTRSSCPLSLLHSGIYFDKKQREFYYKPWMGKIISGETPMSAEELYVLKERLGRPTVKAHKVFFNPDLHVAFRGPEILVETEAPESKLYADSDMSFAFMSAQDVFPFYELRSSAPMMQDNKHDWSQHPAQYKEELRRRIAAQLDTLVLQGFTHAILGAWGCGCFKNDVEVVAQVYQEEIEKRANYFTHLVFPVLNKIASESKNFGVFKAHLDGMPLAGKAPLHDAPNHGETPRLEP